MTQFIPNLNAGGNIPRPDFNPNLDAAGVDIPGPGFVPNLDVGGDTQGPGYFQVCETASSSIKNQVKNTKCSCIYDMKTKNIFHALL